MPSFPSFCWVLQDPKTGQNKIGEGPRALPEVWTTPYAYVYNGNSIEAGLTFSGFENLTEEQLHYYGWLPHVLIDPPHTQNDKFLGSVFEIKPDVVEEVNQYRPKTPEEILEDLWPTKEAGIKELNETDWTALPSVGDPEQSNPYLVNQAEFIAWRSVVRNMVVNTQPGDIIPPRPVEVWSTNV